MSRAGQKFLCVLILATAGWAVNPRMTWAHRDRGPDDPCRRQIGDGLLHLTLYQPQFDPDAEYCEEIPRAGKVVVVVDVTPGELRETPLGVEVMTDDNGGQPQTILSLPPKTYELGIADGEAVMKEGNSYIARVLVELKSEKEPQLLSFPIRVAAWYRALIKPALILIGLLLFIVASVVRYQIVARRGELVTK